MNNTKKSFKNLSEIVESCEDDIKNNNKSVAAILDIEDLKFLRTMLLEFDKLKKDNYKLDRENQKLFESQINSISKKELKDYIVKELEAIDSNETINKNVLDGMKAVYLSIKNIFLNEKQ